MLWYMYLLRKVSEYDEEIPQSHTADKPMAPWERGTEHNGHMTSKAN